MKKSLNTPILMSGLMLILSACTEIRPLTSPEDPIYSPGSSTTCQAPPIEKNIIGTWHFESTYNLKAASNPGAVTSGTVAFDAQGNITDPDSLFENHIYGETVSGRIISDSVTAKKYDPKPTKALTSRPPGDWFDVHLTTKRGKQTNYFSVVSNGCNRIHMISLNSGNNGIGFFLTR